jgi:hypothetical protein
MLLLIKMVCYVKLISTLKSSLQLLCETSNRQKFSSSSFPEVEERRRTGQEKPSRSENEPYLVRVKTAPGGNQNLDLALTRQMLYPPNYLG